MIGENNYHVYKITYKPTGQIYIGQAAQHAKIRFEEHMHGFGSLEILELIRDCGATRDDFELTILKSCDSSREAKAFETALVREYGTQWPVGLNTGSTGATRHAYAAKAKKYAERGWCTVSILLPLYESANMYVKNRDYKTVDDIAQELTPMQHLIELVAKNQNLKKDPITYAEMQRMRNKMAQSASMKNTLNSNTEAKKRQMAGRKKLSDRRKSGLSTEAELLADIKRKDIVSNIWANRSPEERVQILSAATTAAAISNRKS